MLDQRFRIEAQELRIGANHLERFEPFRHAGHVAEFDRLEVIGVDAGSLARLFEAEAPRLTLTFEIPAGLACGITFAVRFFADELPSFGLGLHFSFARAGFGLSGKLDAVVTHAEHSRALVETRSPRGAFPKQ